MSLLYLLTLSILLLYTFFSERGLIRVHQLTLERDYIKSKSNTIESQNEKLLLKSTELKYDFKQMEKTARAELDLVRDDEILYKFMK